MRIEQIPLYRAMQKKNSPNIYDVARLAGFSIATVSRALSSPEKLRPATLARVQNAIGKLGYLSSGVARALVSRRTHTIGAVFPSLDSVFSSTTYALQKELDSAGYTLVVSCNEYDPQIETRLAKNLIEQGVDGLVLVGTTHTPELFGLIDSLQIPYVLTWASDPAGRLPCVGFNNRKATALITRHLIELGHGNFAMISGLTVNNERAQERVAGVTETLANFGLSLPQSHFIEAPFDFIAARKATKKLMSRAKRPTAIVCGNDVLAVGAMAECHAMGLTVPDDVSSGGCGDFGIASMVTPGLTTVRWPTRELGKYAAIHLQKTLSGSRVLPQQEFPVELVVRKTTAAPGGK